MKKILITGKNSYIGISLEKWLMTQTENYLIDTVDTRHDIWKNTDFSKYDVVFHVAGIAHVSTDPKLKDLYYQVNRDLTISVAEKAKVEGVKQFIFMSSIIVYGDSTSSKRVITRDTEPTPSNFYGDSKLQAEIGIRLLETDEFKIVILRPPMIYGEGSKGNYPKLSKLAKITPIFPDLDNERSMLHIDNLCEFLKVVIDKEATGLYFPQNKEYVKTSELVQKIAEIHNKKVFLTKAFNPIIKKLFKISTVNKVFGNLTFEQSISEFPDSNYHVRDLEESITLTEKKQGLS